MKQKFTHTKCLLYVYVPIFSHSAEKQYSGAISKQVELPLLEKKRSSDLCLYARYMLTLSPKHI